MKIKIYIETKIIINARKVEMCLKKRQKKRGKLLTSHRSTSYLCYVPVLEDSEGAGRVRLTPPQR